MSGDYTKGSLTTFRQTYVIDKGIIMLYTVIVVLLVLWLIGLVGHIGGGLIHALLVVAVVVFIFNMISGRNRKI
jgi:4-hydroxybenzoate polyprenyltransferase